MLPVTFLRAIYVVIYLSAVVVGFVICSVGLHFIQAATGWAWLRDPQIGSLLAASVGSLPMAWLVYKLASRLDLPLGLDDRRQSGFPIDPPIPRPTDAHSEEHEDRA